ncbi:MAG TPA: XTP/dITP diphosphatase [Candidatus Aminicenantes bacterium]|nr:XTP/dITP diphosphatase [Candidatus Aminicenantes bacterium]
MASRKYKLVETSLLIATHNQGKVKEIRKHLASLPLKIISLADLGIDKEYQETGSTFAANSRGKALYYGRFTQELILAEDSGLEIEALQGAPGVYSARFAGPRASDEDNIQKVLALLQGVPHPQRKARFICWLTLAQEQQIITEIQGKVEGYITEAKKGKYGFGYDPIFYYPPWQKTLAELTPEEKNRISHRGQALTQLHQFLTNFLGRANHR